MRKYMRGVTLTELMIVILIVGILGAIAYPNYREFAARAKRNEAKAELLRIATIQERFYLQNSTFASQLTQLGYPADTITTGSESYTVRITSGDTSNFTARATYANTDAESTKCNTFDIDGRGTKSSLPYTDCWTRTR